MTLPHLDTPAARRTRDDHSASLVAAVRLRMRSITPFFARPGDAHTCSYAVRPLTLVAYEHMFPPPRTSTLAQRALGALRLTRSFLLLEDDREVDWEVDQDERGLAIHPHRVALRGRLSPRRPGEPLERPQVCLCPIEPGTRPASSAGRQRTGTERASHQSGPRSGRAQAQTASVPCTRGAQARRA